MILVTYKIKTVVSKSDGKYIINEEMAQEDLEIYEGEIPEKKRRLFADHITPFDIVSLSASGKDIENIINVYKGIRIYELHGQKNMTWFGDDAKFIYAHTYYPVISG